MAMSKDEITQLIEKLRNRYAEYAEKYSPKWFDIEGFEERIRMAFRNKMNLEGFVLAEVTNFEKIKERYDKKKQQKKFSEHVDKIIEDNLARIKKYPEVAFNNRAGIEIRHFYGALQGFANYYFPIIWVIIEDSEIKNKLLQYEQDLAYLAVSRGRKEAKRIEDHVNVLSRKNVSELDVEKDKNNYLKESAFILHSIIDFCDALIERKVSAWEQPMRLDKLFIEEEKKRELMRIFLNHTGYGAIIKVREQAQTIIDDFRLEAFKKQEKPY